MMGLYRKKPVEVEAFRWEGARTAVPRWFNDAVNEGKARANPNTNLNEMQAVISTLEGDMIANVGDYIIKGVKGELYPCKPDIFKATYEEVR